MKIAVNSIQFDPSPDTDEQELKDLADSIKEIGLSHPVIVRPANDSGMYPLATGERRVRAFQLLGLAEIEAEVRNVDETEGKLIQAHENLQRHNLPWWEAVQLVQVVHNLRQSQHGAGTKGRPKVGEEKAGWGIRDTARELGLAIGPVAEDLQLARAVQLDPSLRNIKDKKTAVRLVRIAAKRHEAETTASLPSDVAVNQAFHGDSASILQQLPAHSVDHVVTDPPWINFFDPTLAIDERTLPVLKECYRVMKTDAFLVMFSGIDDIVYYCGYDTRDEKGEIVHQKGQLERIGFSVAKTPLIWHKLKSLSRRGVRPWEYDRDFEFIIIAVKGSPALTSSTAISSFKAFDAVPVRSLIHPNEKPLELLKDIIKDVSYEGNIILDPFGGSFVTAHAAKEMKRRWLVCERDRETFIKGCKRIGFKND
jgi:DNA modification methylase